MYTLKIGEFMKQDPVISTRIKNEIVTRIKKLENFTTISDFIQKAILNEIIKKEQSSKNTKTMEHKISDIEIKLQSWIDETRKQSKLLKLIHKRSAKSSELSKLIVDSQFEGNIGDKLVDEVELKTNAEIQMIGI